MKNYEIEYNGKTFVLTEDELLSQEIQASLPDDIKYRVITSPSDKKVDLGNVFTYEIYDTSSPLKNGVVPSDYDYDKPFKKVGTVSASNEKDALDQAKAMGIRGNIKVTRVGGSVAPTQKPTDVKGREELLIKRGMNPKEASTMAKVMPYASSDVYDKPLSEVDLMSGAAQRDVFSLPGRFLASRLGGTNEGEDQWTSMGRTAEDEGTNIGGSIVRSPATGVGTLLAPLATMGVGALGVASPWLVGALEGGSIGAGTSAFNYATDEDYTLADAAIETLLSAGIGTLIKGGSAKSIEKAKNMIKSAGNFTQNQIDYIYNKLGITRGGTTKNLETSVPYEFDKLGDIEYSYRPKAPLESDKLPKVVRDLMQADYEKGWRKSAEPAVDLGNVIPDETIYTYEQSIRNGIANRKINPDQAANKFKILEEYKQWKKHLDQVNSEMGDEPVDLDKLIKDAQYFYQKDPELGNIILDNIDAQYKMNYVKMMTDPETMSNGIELAPLADLKSKFLNLNTITQYTANPPAKATPRPFKFTEPGSWASPATRIVNTPESATNVGTTLQALRMPSIVSAQDVLGNSGAPEYLNLNQMRSK